MKIDEVEIYVAAITKTIGKEPYHYDTYEDEHFGNETSWEWIYEEWRFFLWHDEEGETGWGLVGRNINLSLDDSCGELKDITPQELVDLLKMRRKEFNL